jgi:general secretion pathway protein G
MKSLHHRSGFTLVELVIVIAVVAILAGLLTPTLANQMERSRTARAQSDVNELSHAVARLRTDTSVSLTGCVDVLANLTSLTVTSSCTPLGAFSTGLSACATAKPGNPCWSGPYVSTLPEDPWGASYYATLNTTNFSVTVGSAGPDGISGNSDDSTSLQ